MKEGREKEERRKKGEREGERGKIGGREGGREARSMDVISEEDCGGMEFEDEKESRETPVMVVREENSRRPQVR